MRGYGTKFVYEAERTEMKNNNLSDSGRTGF